MVVVYVVLVIAIVLVIAAAVIGREARRLDAVPPRPVFDLDEAVGWVADHLPFEVSAVLSHDEVRQVIDWNLEFFRSRGPTGNGSGPRTDGRIVVGGAETVDFVLDRARSAGLDISPRQAHAVLDAQLGYLRAIQAIGPEAPPEDRAP